MFTSTLNKEELVPSSRIVYLKEIASTDFIFYTNYNSQKGKELESNPKSLHAFFFWPNQQRQVLIYGTVSKIDSKKVTPILTPDQERAKLGHGLLINLLI